MILVQIFDKVYVEMREREREREVLDLQLWSLWTIRRLNMEDNNISAATTTHIYEIIGPNLINQL